ncbi:fimbrial protein [Cronobacter dublinensis]|uniref:fimbrial protein n=1 Tax=Cronobacter dublinensis TaxID=413497 RepID=UPI003ADD30EC
MKKISRPLLLILLSMIYVGQVQAGTINSVPGISSTRGLQCWEGLAPVVFDEDVKFVANRCTLSVPSNNYVPESGQYKLKVELRGIYPLHTQQDWTYSANTVTVDANIPIGNQNLTFSGGGKSIQPALQNGDGIMCFYLIPQSGKYAGQTYYINGILPVQYAYYCDSGSVGPLPPTPPQPVISCKVNNANSLDVNLGTLDRAVIPTVPGSGQPQSAQFPVTCTGGAASMKMQLNYTPITVSGSQVVNSSINGLGVAISYNDKILAPSDITTMQFPEGNTDVTLKFEAVRNPSVEVGDIKTGPFTASAVLVMTQQ